MVPSRQYIKMDSPRNLHILCYRVHTAVLHSRIGQGRPRGRSPNTNRFLNLLRGKISMYFDPNTSDMEVHKVSTFGQKLSHNTHQHKSTSMWFQKGKIRLYMISMNSVLNSDRMELNNAHTLF